MKITVQLAEVGPITEMDETELERHDLTFDNERERVEVVEYWIPGAFFENAPTDRYVENRVHRSVHVKPKTLPQ
jgi:hypothetical protein